MSLPDYSGSSIRSRGIVISQKSIGIEPIVLTSPFQKPLTLGSEKEYIDRIKYVRSYNGISSQEVNDNKSSLYKQFKKILHIFSFRKKIYSEAKKNKIDIIHAHSTFFCGLAALYVAKKLSIPFIYEVRSLWDYRIADRDRDISSWISSRIIRLLENFVIHRADHVIVISNALKENLLSRGIVSKNITIVKNSIENDLLRKGLLVDWPINKQHEFVFAYIGSITNIEGLELLLDAWKKIYSPTMLCKLKFYGDGVIKDKLIIKIKQENIPNVKFCGAFPPGDMEKVYSKVDVVVNPRYKTVLSDTVTPLKPLEAMAFQKLVLASDVGGMQELISHNRTGYLFKSNDITSLIYWLDYILSQDIKELSRVAKNGRNYVYNEHNWNHNALTYKKLYATLL